MVGSRGLVDAVGRKGSALFSVGERLGVVRLRDTGKATGLGGDGDGDENSGQACWCSPKFWSGRDLNFAVETLSRIAPISSCYARKFVARASAKPSLFPLASGRSAKASHLRNWDALDGMMQVGPRRKLKTWNTFDDDE